jgi:hypothetical protein
MSLHILRDVAQDPKMGYHEQTISTPRFLGWLQTQELLKGAEHTAESLKLALPENISEKC